MTIRFIAIKEKAPSDRFDGSMKAPNAERIVKKVRKIKYSTTRTETNIAMPSFAGTFEYFLK
jgi:hypothetical protein